MQRIPYDAINDDELIQYFNTRYYQLSSIGFTWDKVLHKTPFGYFTNFVEQATNKTFHAFYVLKQDRGQGFSQKLVHQLTESHPIVTINDCKVIEFLEKQRVPFHVVTGSFDMHEYKLVESQYGDGRANRSKIWFMNHIDEGMIILNHINASEAAKAAFCLHPMTQMDDDLSKNFFNLSNDFNVKSSHLAISLEYRNIANQYLSKHYVSNDDNITLSPIKEVNDMLIADKVQNYKDFILYHKGTHPRSDILENYFKNWLKKLACENVFEWFMEHSKQFQTTTIIQNH